MTHKGMKFGIFLAPFHRVGENPTLALNRDMELIEWLDYLGYDEVWIGEHHSPGWELIASPEIFIAAAAQRTRHIMLGSGVTSLPYHHPFLVAQRFVQLDHMTRVRAMLKKDADHHLKWLFIDLTLLLASAPLMVIPGPNLPGFYFTFQVAGHFLSWRGAKQVLGDTT